MSKQVLLIAIGVSMTDIRIAMALQKLKEEDYVVINDEEAIERHMPKKEDAMSIELKRNLMDISPAEFIHLDREEEIKHKPYKSKLNVRARDITGFRGHPQMVRRG